MIVDGRTSIDALPDSRSVHFDLPNDDLHVGGLATRHRYGRRGSRRHRPTGFQGCLASIVLNGEAWRLSERRADIDDEFLDDIVEGCEGLFCSIKRQLNVNRSLTTSILKKPTLDKEELSNYSSISYLSVISKIIERVVKSRLTEHLSTHNLLNPQQSA